MGGPGLEYLLRHDRRITIVGLVILCGLAWLYLLGGAGMNDGAVSGLGLLPHQPVVHRMATMKAPTGAGMWLLAVTMWWVMMIAMMIPSAAPTILLYSSVCRHAAASGSASSVSPVGAFAAGYLLVWLLFSVAASAVGHFVDLAGTLSPLAGTTARWPAAALLVAVGVYQWSPLKNACLSHCRSPAAFLSRHWRPGKLGALRLGALHGVYCVGCCWMLMTLLFVGGAMNLLWIAALTLLVMIEKLVPKGEIVGRIVGIVLIGWSMATVVL